MFVSVNFVGCPNSRVITERHRRPVCRTRYFAETKCDFEAAASSPCADGEHTSATRRNLHPLENPNNQYEIHGNVSSNGRCPIAILIYFIAAAGGGVVAAAAVAAVANSSSCSNSSQ